MQQDATNFKSIYSDPIINFSFTTHITDNSKNVF